VVGIVGNFKIYRLHKSDIVYRWESTEKFNQQLRKKCNMVNWSCLWNKITAKKQLQ